MGSGQAKKFKCEIRYVKRVNCTVANRCTEYDSLHYDDLRNGSSAANSDIVIFYLSAFLLKEIYHNFYSGSPGLHCNGEVMIS